VRNRDWSLVLFTTLSQLSIGIIVCFTLAGLFNDGTGLFIENDLSLSNPVLLALVLIGIATLISFMHLGNPSNAPNALNNLAGSWVSREILALSIYALCLLIVFISGWMDWNVEFRGLLLALNAASGLVLLWMMIRIYVMPTIPAWNSWYTPLSFVLTTISLGLITLLLFNDIGLVSMNNLLSKASAVTLFAVLLMEVVAGFIHQKKLENMDTGIDELVFGRGVFHKVFLFRMVILIMALLVLCAILFNPDPVSPDGNLLRIYLLLVLVIAQAFIGRLLFYSSYFRVGV
jgi:anaerobic dimethyl sulfoxide reductase subunit C (anchor subunit)